MSDQDNNNDDDVNEAELMNDPEFEDDEDEDELTPDDFDEYVDDVDAFPVYSGSDAIVVMQDNAPSLELDFELATISDNFRDAIAANTTVRHLVAQRCGMTNESLLTLSNALNKQRYIDSIVCNFRIYNTYVYCTTTTAR